MLNYLKISRVGLIVLGVLFLSVTLKDSVRADSPYRNTQSWTGAGPGGTPITITFSTPAGPSGSQIYSSCTSASDLLYTTGVPSNWTLTGHVNLYYFFVDPATLISNGAYPVAQSGDLNLTVYYPPANQWPGGTNTRVIVADLSIYVRDSLGTLVTWVNYGLGYLGPNQNWNVSCLNPPVPALSITKYTNGIHSSDPNAIGVPRVAPGNPVNWTYKLTNTGTVPVAQRYLDVTDNQPNVTPGSPVEISGNGNLVFDPGEVWQYSASGTAYDLSVPHTGVTTVPISCTENKTRPPSTAYLNTGTVTPLGGPSWSDVSSYCNPPPNVPAISVIKYVSVDNQVTWYDANTAPGPTTFVNTNVFFKFRVTNIGSFPLSQITLTDNTYSMSSCSIPSSMAVGALPSECVIGPFPAQLGQHTNTATVTGNWTSGTVSDQDVANYFAKKYYNWLPLILK